jgi:hypothetical protein
MIVQPAVEVMQAEDAPDHDRSSRMMTSFSGSSTV